MYTFTGHAAVVLSYFNTISFKTFLEKTRKSQSGLCDSVEHMYVISVCLI